MVDGTEDLLLVTQAGILIRTPVDSIRTAGRATQGVIVMRFKEEGDHVISLALTDHEEAALRPRNKAVRSRGENASAGMFIRTQGELFPRRRLPHSKPSSKRIS